MKNLFAFLGVFAFLTQAYGYSSEDIELQNTSNRTITISTTLDELNTSPETKIILLPGAIQKISLSEYLKIMISKDDGTTEEKRLRIRGKSKKTIRLTDDFIRNQFGLNK